LETTPIVYADILGFIGRTMGPPEFDELILDRLKECGVCLIQYGGPYPMHQDWEGLLREVQTTAARFEENEVFLLVKKQEDLPDLKSKGRVHIVMTVQNPRTIGEEWNRLRELWEAGVRVVQLAYWADNEPYAHGFLSPNDTGVTPLGLKYMREAHERHFILDLSHLGPKSAMQAADKYQGPIMISHTGSQSVYGYPRNATDDVITKVAQRGGVIGVYTMTFFLDPQSNNIQPWLNHVEHIVSLVGEDHVAVGSDAPVTGIPDEQLAQRSFEALTKVLDESGRLADYPPRWPAFIVELNNVDRFLIMRNFLSERFGAKIAQKILGLNALRFYERALLP
jgi:membrane dipeptidase